MLYHMNDYSISGIQQIGIGVRNLQESWNWYIDMFGMNCKIFEEEAEAKIMLPYTGNKARKRHAVLAINLQGGSGFEVWQYKEREPLALKEEIRLGDIGILACKMKVKDIGKAYSFFSEKGSVILNEPTADPSGKKTFYMKDPFGNLFHINEGDGWFMDTKHISGGSYGAVIGVSDIDRARELYSDILGYDQIIYDITGTFPDLTNIPGNDEPVRRVLLANSKPFIGPFSKLFGQSMMELVCSTGKPGKKIYEGRYWGDPGFIHICFDIRGIDHLKARCSEKGFPFTVDSKESYKGQGFDMGEAGGHFAYVEDPDGTLIEFVETLKIPLVKKLGWYLDLSGRKPEPLPDWMLKMLKFSRVKARK